MKPLHAIFALVFFFPVVHAVQLMGAEQDDLVPLPFAPGEKLSFQLKWGFIPVGSAVLETHEPEEVNGTRCHKISLTVSTNKFADSIYKVRTHAVSYVEEGFGRSILFHKKQREGKTDRDVVVRFDYDNKVALYSNHGVASEPLKIPDQVFDPLAIAYLFRLGDAEAGKERKLPTCDGKRVQEVLVKVGKKTKLRTPSGKYEANEVSPALENLRGVFSKSPGGYLRIWYSTDKRRMPVRMQSKVIVGSFVAKLKEARFP